MFIPKGGTAITGLRARKWDRRTRRSVLSRQDPAQSGFLPGRKRQPSGGRDHLAGRIAVELRKALESSKIIAPRGDKDYEVWRRGERWFSNLGIEVARLRRSRRSFARQCLAGALGAALYFRLSALGWIAQLPKTRAVRVTHLAQRELQKLFGITV